MGDTTLEHRSRTALSLALPVAVAVHVLGTLVSGLAIGALMGSWSPSSLSTVLTTTSAVISLTVVILCVIALVADHAAARSRGWTLATRTLAAALLVPALNAVLWYTGVGVERIPNLSMAVAMVGMLSAAVALVAGVIAATRDPAHRGAAAVMVAAVAAPAALLTPALGMVVRSPGAYTVATVAAVVLAVVGLVAAVVALRRGGSPAMGTVSTVPGPVTGTGHRGRRFLRHLATPLAFLALVLAVPTLAVADGEALTGSTLAAAFALAVAGIVGAVLEVRVQRRGGGVQVASNLAAFTLPLAVTLVPVATALAILFGDEDGWALLGALIISVPLAGVVTLIGLIAAIVAAVTRQYPGRVAAASVLCTALVPVALALFVPLQAAGASLVSTVLAGLLLLAALVTGLVTAISGTARAETRDAPVEAAPQNPYR